ncbi:MAG: carbon-nitrogen hydrolase family protein [Pseudomonadota bacterium]
MTARFTAACIQFTAARDFVPSIEAATALIRTARDRGADLVALPENCTMIEPVTAEFLRKSVPEDRHPGLETFRALAAETGAWILIGSLSIKVADDKVANRSFLVDGDGAIVARYDKIYLFDVSLREDEWYRESDYVRPGDRAVLAPTPWGLLGMTVCYDLRFPHLYRALAQAGAAFVAIPSAFTRTTGMAHWHVLNRARAIETGAYVLAPAQCGVHAEGRKTYGHSLIVDPWGEVLADGGEEPGVILAEIDLAKAEKARRRIPSLSHDRPYREPTLPSVEGRKGQLP